ncbi:MAG: dienelactone hydrolase [Pseudomonadota bacterium]
MTLHRLALLAALCVSAAWSHAAGFSFIEVPADKDGPALRGAVWTPCEAAPGEIAFGLIAISAAKDCPVAGTGLPLVLMSHGSGGSFLGHHDTAAALADAGFVVAAINHPNDNFQDMERRGHLSTFAARPVDMRRLADHMLKMWPGRAKIAAEQVGFFGFSRGGYTGLVATGAVPDFKLGLRFCTPASKIPFCGQIQRQELPAPPVRDARIKAAVIVDPLSFFDAEGLKQVTVPVQLWASARGGDGVTLDDVEAVRRHLPSAPDWYVPANTAHFAFLAPCAPAMAKALPEICSDAGGFDRVAFHADFNAKVLAFFRQHLASKP